MLHTKTHTHGMAQTDQKHFAYNEVIVASQCPDSVTLPQYFTIWNEMYPQMCQCWGMYQVL